MPEHIAIVLLPGGSGRDSFFVAFGGLPILTSLLALTEHKIKNMKNFIVEMAEQGRNKPDL